MSTLRKILIIISGDHAEGITAQAQEAAAAYRSMGLETALFASRCGDGDPPSLLLSPLPSEPGTERPEKYAQTVTWDIAGADDYETLCIADSSAVIRILKSAGAAVAGFSHELNSDDRLDGAQYILSELAYIDEDSLQKLWQRQRNLPWRILETDRCLVREFVPGDLEAIIELYDDRARRFLEAPSADLHREREILSAYIDRVYPLYGHGDWAVILAASGELIGRIGLSFPLKCEGLPQHDASLGYLVKASARRRGIAGEVCSAVLDYGFDSLGFARICAETAEDNAVSQHLLHLLGFVPVTEEQGKRYYMCTKEAREKIKKEYHDGEWRKQ